MLSVIFTGDTMLADAVKPLVATNGYPWVFERLGPLPDGVVIANHEAPITTLDEPFTPTKLYSYSADPGVAPVLRDAGIQVLGLANNHVMDMGPEGLADTMRHAEAAGLATFGAGLDDTEAERPLIIRGDGVTVGVVALAKGYGGRITAGRNRAGTIPLSEASIERGYALARKAGADYVVAYVHWGKNYNPEILDEQRRQAGQFAAAGYDLVVGQGTHVPQAAEVVGSTPVFYSLGNYVFGTRGRFGRNPGYGLVLKAMFTSEGLDALSVDCLDVDNARVAFQPRSCDETETAAVLAKLNVSTVTEWAASRK
jgi:poly-gamma-glutamate synthesis protein (capsule biosynthesis protein)